MDKKILDACCGSRMFWFNKTNPNVLYQDNRTGEWVTDTRPGRKQTIVNPDVKADFCNMPYENNTFQLVVFDPPHLLNLSEKTRLAKKYGTLNDNWKNILKKGFSECFRVLKNDGILIFKWNEYHIRLAEILKLTNYEPLFGHKSGKQQKTHWVCFMKIDGI